MATKHVMLLLAESFAFLGDMSGQGTDYNHTARPLVNLSRQGAYEWYYGTRRVTMRRFYQQMAKNIYHLFSMGDLCPNLTKEKSEQLLDMYGLLLFKHYDDNGTFSDSSSTQNVRRDSYVISGVNGVKGSNLDGFFGDETLWDGLNYPNFPDDSFPLTTAPTGVDELNRAKTLLVPKSTLKLKSNSAYSTLLLDDSTAFAQDIATKTLFEGRIISFSTGLAGAEYNNSNLKISPGEVVGLVMNFENSGNTPIAGVSILATPWAHMVVQNDPTSGLPSWRALPCSINNFPLTSEGGQSTAACADGLILPTDGARFKKPATGVVYPAKALHPVCLVQYNANNETRWMSQDEYRRTVMQIEDKHCLGFGSPDFVPAECLMRFLPGRDAAFLAKIDPLKSYRQTVAPVAADKLPSSAALALEVNKKIAPGTMFTCRLRAQFSNCSDCYQDAAGDDEYTDIEYGGHKPFRVIDLPLTILD
jgi:hypothetical protein